MRSSLMLMALLTVACTASHPPTNACTFPGECDPQCPGNFSSTTCIDNPSSSYCSCSTVGHGCVYFEWVLACACDHQYHCAGYSVGEGCRPDAGDVSVAEVRCGDM